MLDAVLGVGINGRSAIVCLMATQLTRKERSYLTKPRIDDLNTCFSKIIFIAGDESRGNAEERSRQ